MQASKGLDALRKVSPEKSLFYANTRWVYFSVKVRNDSSFTHKPIKCIEGDLFKVGSRPLLQFGSEPNSNILGELIVQNTHRVFEITNGSMDEAAPLASSFKRKER